MTEVTVVVTAGADAAAAVRFLGTTTLAWQVVCAEAPGNASGDRVAVISASPPGDWLDRALAAARGEVVALAGRAPLEQWLEAHLTLHRERGEAVVFTPAGACAGLERWDLPPFHRVRADAISAPAAALRRLGPLAGLPAAVAVWRLWRSGMPAVWPASGLAETPGEAWARGAAAAAAAAGDANALAAVLGPFGEGTPREPPARRALLRLRLSPRMAEALLGRTGISPELARDIACRYAFWRGAYARLDPPRRRALRRPVRILMYHAFAAEAGQPVRYIVGARQLRRQLLVLRLLGFRFVALDDVVRRWRAGRPAPRRAVAITIDDAYADTLEVAAPILRRFRAPASLFVPSALVGTVNGWSEGDELAGRPLLDAAGLQAVRRSGIEVEAHSRTHAGLDAEDADLDGEVAGSRRDLERLLGRSPELFAFPGGRFSDASVRAVERAGFGAAFSTRPRAAYPGGSLHCLPRIEVRGTLGALQLALRVRRGRP